LAAILKMTDILKILKTQNCSPDLNRSNKAIYTNLWIIKSPKQIWGTYCFCSVSYYYFYYYYSSLSPFFLRTMNLSTADLRN
jgi:hypothetical protein